MRRSCATGNTQPTHICAGPDATRTQKCDNPGRRRQESLQRHVEQESDARTEQGNEAFYNELLDLLARDLDRRGIEVVFIGVTNHLGRFPNIAAKVRALQDEGFLIYLPTEPWFERVSDDATPERHAWGAKAHRIVGEKLAPVVEGLLADGTHADRPERLSGATHGF